MSSEKTMSRRKFAKLGVVGLGTLVLAGSGLIVSGSRASAASLPTQIVNGDFSYPNPWDVSGFESYAMGDLYIDPATGAARITRLSTDFTSTIANFDSSLLGWNSTQQYSDDGAGVARAGTVQINYDHDTGNAFAELTIDAIGSAIYQDIATSPGALYKWSLKHCSFTSAYVDKMQVLIGSTSSQTAQKAKRTTVNGNGDKLGVSSKTISTTNSNANYGYYSGQWETYTGAYLIPTGQTTTRFTFKSVSSDGSATSNHGNNLDDISFAIAYPVYYDLTGGTTSADLDPTSDDYAGYYCYGETVSLTSAVPTRSGYTFMGWSRTKIADVKSESAYTSAEKKIVTSTTMNVASGSGITLYAVWVANFYDFENPVKSYSISNA